MLKIRGGWEDALDVVAKAVGIVLALSRLASLIRHMPRLVSSWRKILRRKEVKPSGQDTSDN